MIFGAVLKTWRLFFLFSHFLQNFSAHLVCSCNNWHVDWLGYDKHLVPILNFARHLVTSKNYFLLSGRKNSVLDWWMLRRFECFFFTHFESLGRNNANIKQSPNELSLPQLDNSNLLFRPLEIFEKSFSSARSFLFRPLKLGETLYLSVLVFFGFMVIHVNSGATNNHWNGLSNISFESFSIVVRTAFFDFMPNLSLENLILLG